MTDHERLKQAIIDMLEHAPDRAIKFIYGFLLEWTASR